MKRILHNLPLLILAGLLIGMGGLNAQQLDDESRVELTLRDGTQVVLYAAVNHGNAAKMYYYLPTHLRLSQKKDGTPEFSFLTYQDNENSPVAGGILHFLLTWGLTSEQEKEVNTLLKKLSCNGATLLGPISVEASQANKGLLIGPKNHGIATLLNRSVSSQGSVPNLPGSKMALSFRFSGEDAIAMNEALHSPSKLTGITMGLEFEFYTDEKQNDMLRAEFKQWVDFASKYPGIID